MLSRYHFELAFAGVIFLVGAIGVIGSRELEIAWGARGPQAGFFPFRISIVLMAAAAGVAFQAWRSRQALSLVEIATGEGGRRIALFALPALGLVVLAQWLGLYVAMTLYLFLTIFVLARRTLLTGVLVALAVPAVSFVVFELWFKVPLMKGPLEALLGLG